MELEYKKGILIVKIHNNLNKYNYLKKVIKHHNIKKVIFNFEDLQSITTSCIKSILNIKNLVEKSNGSVFFKMKS